MLVTSVVASMQRWTQAKRWLRAATAAALVSGVLAASALAVAHAEPFGPWPESATAATRLAVGVAVICAVVTFSVHCLAEAVILAATANREVSEHNAGELRHAREDMLAELRRLAQDRAGQVHGLAVWLERLAVQHHHDLDRVGAEMGRVADLVERAREQGRAEERDVARIREAHLRDEHRADVEQVAREERRIGYERGVQVGRAQRVAEEERDRDEDAQGLGPKAIEALRRMDRRLNGRD